MIKTRSWGCVIYSYQLALRQVWVSADSERQKSKRKQLSILTNFDEFFWIICQKIKIFQNMPLPAALAARLAKRGIISKKSAQQQPGK